MRNKKELHGMKNNLQRYVMMYFILTLGVLYMGMHLYLT